jgi:S1-C subfamily serine protease
VILTAMALAPGSASAQDVGDVFNRVKDAVVVIYTTQTDYTVVSPSQPVSVGGLGSGAIISPTEILTAAHVVQAADRVWVEFTSGDTIPARVVRSDQGADVALLELARPAPAPPAAVGDSDLVEVGDEVFVVGAPLGQTHTLTVGHLSARRSNNMMFGGFDPVETFQTDAAINQGNSGGPMFNMAGELIGVVSHILSTTGGFVGLGYAITSNEAMATVRDPSVRYWGWELLPMEGALARLFNLPPPHTGALVQRVAAGSAAEAFGIRPGVLELDLGGLSFLVGGDVLIGAMGIPLGEGFENLSQIEEALDALMPGQAVTLTVLRGGEQVILRGRPPS